MKKSIEKFEGKTLNNAAVVKGGGIGRGTKGAYSQSSTRTELL